MTCSRTISLNRIDRASEEIAAAVLYLAFRRSEVYHRHDAVGRWRIDPLSNWSDHRGELMKLLISFMTAISLSLTSTALADHYNDLVVQGYRWVTADGPYICHAQEDVRQLVSHRTDATELQAVENVHCHYLIPGTVVQVIKEDPAKGMSQISVGGITTPLWTYGRFLSKHPFRDTYGVIETPENSGLIPTADTAIVPTLPSDSSTAPTLPNGNP